MRKVIIALLCVVIILTSVFVGCYNTRNKEIEAATQTTVTTTVKPTITVTTTKQTTAQSTTIKTETTRPQTTTKKPTTTKKRVITTTATTTENKSGYYTINCRISHYCPCATCNGSSSGLTATGTRLKPYYTVAVDSSVIPLGSKIEINGNTYYAEDTGVRGRSIDICVSSHSEAYSKGVYYADVKVFS